MRTRRIVDYTYTNFAPLGDATLAVYFGICWPDTGMGELVMPAWSREAFGSTKHIPGSNRNDTHQMGMGPYRNSYNVWLESRAGFRALETLQQATGTLTLPRNICDLDGTEIDLFGTIYVQLADVGLKTVGGARNYLDGSVECLTSWELPNEEGD